MLKPTRSRLQLLWFVLVTSVVLASLLPCVGVSINMFDSYLNGHWVHFLVYVALSSLPLLAWTRRTALALSAGTAVLGTALEMVRSSVEARSPDIQYIVINALGVAAGILLGLNILARRSRMSQADI
jgi:hypothetical protein